MNWLLEKFQRAVKRSQSRYMVAIWHMTDDGVVHLDLKTHQFQTGNFSVAINLLTEDLKQPRYYEPVVPGRT